MGSHPNYFLRTNERNKMTEVLLRSPGKRAGAARITCIKCPAIGRSRSGEEMAG